MEPPPIERHRYAVVLAGGDPVDEALAAELPPDPYVVAADSGVSQAETLGLHVDIVVGDLDSVDPAALARAEAAGAAVIEHPADKDATDLELAVAAATDAGFRRIVIAGGNGGRLSHLLGNALLIASPRFANVDIEWRILHTRVQVARPDRPVVIDGLPGQLVSLIPAGGPAVGVASRGLRWKLSDDTIEAGSSRGISNELIAPRATVTVTDGVVMVIHEREAS